MKHTFVGSLTDATLCRQCKRPEVDHTFAAICESCGDTAECEVTDKDILMCEKCQARDKEVEDEISALGSTREERVNNVKSIYAQNRQVEQSIRILPEIFNAKMMAIVELAKAVDIDPEIPADEKQFRLAKILDERYHHLKEILVEHRKTITEIENEQRAINQYYNDLAKKLRADQREKIRLKDVTYQPVEPKTIKKPRAPKFSEEKEYVAKLEGEFPHMKGKVHGILKAIMVSQKVTPEHAYNRVKGMLPKQ